MRTPSGTAAVLGVLVLVACGGQPAAPPDTRAGDETAIRATARAWSEAAGAKDVEKFVSFYTEDAVVMLEDAPDISGMTAIRDGIGGMMQDPSFALSFVVDTVVVARSGDIAYETGTYSMTMSGPDGKPATENGRYLTVWRKQPDGSWKVAVDAPISDPPAPAAAK